MGIERLRRVTDLFTEGAELHLGEDESGPVLVWVNKLNPFQAQEAQKDAQARRFIAMGHLKSSGEYDGMVAEVGMLPQDKLAQEFVAMNANEIYLDALNDLDLDKELREHREMLDRAAEVTAGQSEDSPDRVLTEDLEQTWMGKLAEIHKAKTEERLAEAKAMSREQLEEDFLERWREFNTRSEFEREHRMTQIFYAMRVCNATTAESGWDHRACDHSRRLIENREDVRELPDSLIEQVIEKLDELTVPVRAAGNSDAPTSSSGSSEPSRPLEEVSTASSPDAAPSAAPST